MSEIKLIKLTKDKHAIVDASAFEALNKFKWYYRPGRLDDAGYAVRSVWIDWRVGKLRTFRLHRDVIGAKDGELVDHINGDTLDCRIENLRICSHADNLKNQAKRRSNTSGYKGVTWNKRFKKYQARIGTNGVYRSLGYHKCPIEAARAYDTAAIKHHGPFARLNFP